MPLGIAATLHLPTVKSVFDLNHDLITSQTLISLKKLKIIVPYWYNFYCVIYLYYFQMYISFFMNYTAYIILKWFIFILFFSLITFASVLEKEDYLVC